MHFKITRYKNKTLGGVTCEGNAVQCYREKQDGNGLAMVASFNRFAPELPPEVAELFTQDEIQQWSKWKRKHDMKLRRQQLQTALDSASSTIELATKAIGEELEPIEPEAIWRALDNLSKALDRAGYKRPEKPRGRPPIEAEDQYQEEDSPFGSVLLLPNFMPPGTELYAQYQSLLDAQKVDGKN
ncbi:hypothetical protein [Cellvibrio sp. QJXJ]|uniref:hypothetical protein n=1 Tax=Cellvibrio sp. QJXJ TaxID=2964606 RepID=UPI0021C37C32|nr:hypothetical protein [Cellvibrio sp. QJXJ]UUA75281.1 hypothetical protein NNX04_22765 [Cellvibrio sp. QJXJ]